ncbi:DeoR family transcriptional regulator [Sediminihabitans luteus]|uniref:DeoR family transcriptional regulator n=1 Tax=Sediminihabitans luteus TaxID=1138585 RepID=A0A2M9CQL7_9CELL|nr:DeoR/GlpR family DNA-binding transcription regulator [Sediminihabitans luteus]PJJ74138.1 DeoR family transcriptional regulator [Sediminihabitans luteus]GII98991.1 DeoR family transcriptional regulator [Sediminihabitans luteus]
MTDAAQSTASSATSRRRDILERVNDRGFASVHELSEAFGVSQVTVRADVDRLAERGAVRRVRGGALANGHARSERPFEEARTSNAAQKAAIGVAAAALVEAGQTLVLDVGTTTAAVAAALVARTDLTDVTIVTNGLNIATALEPALDRYTVVVTGGTLRRMQHSLVDPMGLVLLDRLHTDLAILGCNGVDVAAGVTNVNLPEVTVKQRMLAAARRVVVVADSTKLGHASLARICDLDEVDVLVTGDAAGQDELTALSATGLEVLQVPTPDAG